MFIKIAQNNYEKNICRNIKNRLDKGGVECYYKQALAAEGNKKKGLRKKLKKVLDKMVTLCYYQSPRTKRVGRKSRQSVPCKLNNV